MLPDVAADGEAETLPLAGADAAADWTPPETLDGYRIVRLLGRGAMGRVYLAEDMLLERPVAVKFMAARDPEGAEERLHFVVEGRAVARLSHPNVVAVHRVGEVDGHPYLVTELVRGRSLAELPRPVAAEQALAIGVGLARGLAAAHRKGVLHRDVKPANVMLTDEGEVKVLDFGLAKMLEDDDEGRSLRVEQAVARDRTPRLSRSGDVIGTPRYMAPETLNGAPATVRSDIYGAGAVLYELLAGASPRETLSDDLSLPEWIAASPRPLEDRPSGGALDPRLASVVHRCLAIAPEDRFPSGDALAEALETLLDDPDEGEIPAGNPYRGLEPFEVEHQGVFFGREVEARAVLRRLRDDALVVVAGDSGVGKSSLCKAGVLPRLGREARERGRRARVVALVPGARPLDALAHALAGVLPTDAADLAALLDADRGALHREVVRGLAADEDLVLLVDQLEELCTLSAPGDAARFGEAVLRLCAAPRVRALLTLRGDYITSVAALGALGADLAASLFLLRPMSEEGVRAAITKPALRKGVAFESEEMVDELVRAATEAPGGLPLLEFALAELWAARDEAAGVLSARALRAMGSVAGALARHADEVLHGLGPGGETAAKRVLLQLVSGDRTRARRTLAELGGEDPGVQAALDALVRGRLVVARKLGEDRVYEVAHEALLSEWETLRRWLDETQERDQLLREIEQAAELWARRGRREEETWAGDALAQAERRVERWGLALPPTGRAFLDAGLTRRRAVQRRRRWVLGGGVGALAVVAMVATVAAFAFAEKEKEAIRQQEQIRLAAGDMGLFDLVLEPFDWDAKEQRSTAAAAPASLDWRLHAVDEKDPHAPGRLYDKDDLRRSSRRVEGTALYEHVEARSGPAFLEVVGRGEGCAPSLIYLQRLPGYTDRVSRAPDVLRLQVPTCHASREGTVEIPAGEFFYTRDTADELTAPIDDIVSLPAFTMDRTEVTSGAFDIYGSLEAQTGDSATRTSYFHQDGPGGARLPIVGVDAATAANYCRFMGKELPTPQQWEKAMRGGLTVNGVPNPSPKRTTPWSSPSSKHPANIEGPDDGFPYLAPVGSFPEDISPYGVMDLGGNVSEWSRTEAPERGLRYLLGANWGSPPEHAIWRNRRAARTSEFDIGIRCVRSD